MEEFVEVIGVEHLKTVLSSLSPEDIVKPAYENWMPGIKTGHTIVNLETGNVYGISVDLNELHFVTEMYIEIFTIKSSEYPIDEQELFSPHEYEEFLEFSSNDPCEYIPDIISESLPLKLLLAIIAYDTPTNKTIIIKDTITIPKVSPENILHAAPVFLT